MSLRIRGASIAWDSAGATRVPPMIWGHGLTSSRADEDAFPLVDLARVRERATVVRYDANGHGESSILAEPERGSWAELARDQVELIDYLGIDSVVLGGVSMGVGTALHSALMLGERLAGLVLVIPPTAWQARAEQVGVYERMARIVETRGTRPLVDALTTMPPPDPLDGNETWISLRQHRLRSAEPTRLAANYRGAAHADLPNIDRLAEISVPTLILAWTGDAVHPVETAQRLDQTVTHAETVISSTASELATWTDRVCQFMDRLTG